MATVEIAALRFSAPANVSMASNQYKLGAINASGKVALSGAGTAVDGVIQNDVAADGAVLLGRNGLSQVHAGAAVAIGDLIASDASGRGVTAVAGDEVCGRALSAAGAAAEYFTMLQFDQSNVGNGALSNEITDPGAGGAIPVTQNGYCPIVSAGAEARTLAIPTWAGQQVMLQFKTDAGAVTITVASAIDQLGRTTIVFDDAGEFVHLVAIENGGALAWRVLGEDNGRGSDENIISDAGTGNPIPVTASGTMMITTAAAETNTLAIPTFIGQRLSLICDVYAVGDRVVTAASAINQTGDTIMTFGAAADAITLQAMQVAGALVWRVAYNDGVALS